MLLSPLSGIVEVKERTMRHFALAHSAAAAASVQVVSS